MNRMKVIRKAIMLALIAGPLAVLLAPAAFAQNATLSGTVLDLTGKPYPNVTLTMKSVETNKETKVTTDDKGHYSAPGLAGGTYNVDVTGKDKDQKDELLYQTGLKLAPNTSPTFDINFKELQEQGKLAAVEAERKRQEAEAQFAALKTHYDAGIAAIEQMKAAQTKLAQTPKEQQDPIKAQVTQAGGTAVTELSAALELEKPEDPNRSIILSRLGEAYESMGKWQDAADTYQKAIALKPDTAANYNNLGNDLAKLGKVDDARAAYQKYVDLKPDDAALAWRNFGTVLYNSNRMKESIEPLQKATTLDPKNATAWLLLGIALVNTMEFKTVGDKITPVMQPGTVEAYQHAIDLDPNGPIGAQAKQGLESLQAMGVGITTKVGEAPPKSTKKK
ncbi:MAG TPA: tetratricopeptide repeat protein [Candidatus Acidoferrales bacterium]|nr:tetratricopeptide repeat protein [Candidatus Acidoferrales bacterium]